MQRKMSHTNAVLGFWDFLMFYQIFLSSHGEQSIIISNKNGIYKLPLKLLQNLGF